MRRLRNSHARTGANTNSTSVNVSSATHRQKSLNNPKSTDRFRNHNTPSPTTTNQPPPSPPPSPPPPQNKTPSRDRSNDPPFPRPPTPPRPATPPASASGPSSGLPLAPPCGSEPGTARSLATRYPSRHRRCSTPARIAGVRLPRAGKNQGGGEVKGRAKHMREGGKRERVWEMMRGGGGGEV